MVVSFYFIQPDLKVPTTQWSDIEKNLKACQSANVVGLIESFQDTDGVYLVLEKYVSRHI